MFDKNITVTALGGSSSASYRIGQIGQPSLDFTAVRDGADILHALAEAFRQGDAWLGCHKASTAQLVSSAGLEDPRYAEIEHWEKVDRGTKVSWNELVVVRAVGVQRHRLAFCIADEDLALDVWGELGDAIDVTAVQ